MNSKHAYIIIYSTLMKFRFSESTGKVDGLDRGKSKYIMS